MSSNIDENLISAFVERWQPDTNTFHMPFGEITILLHDVFFLLDIPVDGDLVRVKGDSVEDDEAEGSKVEDETMKAKLAVFLGVDMETIQPPVYKGGGVSVQTLKTVVESGNQHDAFRAYMMLLLGQTLFMDKSGDRVIAQMLGLFDDLSVVDDYAWGAATLAYLYRQLGMASRGGARGVAGCLSLLQAWIYEYFPDFRPHGGYYLEGRPRAEAWSQVPRCKGNCTLLEQRRQTLDGLRAERVAWTPFGIRPDRQCRKTQYFGLIRFLNILEPYQPDRCMRQFGLVQTQPSQMITPASDYRPTDLPRAGYRVQYGEYADFQWADEFSNIRLVDRTTYAVLPFQVDKKYMAWYKTISHRYLYPPTHRVQFARRREIWDEPEVSRAIARKFSLAFKQPTVEAKKKYVWSLVKKLEPFYTVSPEDDGNEKAAQADTDVEVEGTSC